MTSVNCLELVYAAIDEVNALSDDIQIPKSEATMLIDEAGGIDSLALVHLLTAIEQAVQSHTGRVIVMADEKVFELPENPFQTVGSLAKYLQTLLQQ